MAPFIQYGGRAQFWIFELFNIFRHFLQYGILPAFEPNFTVFVILEKKVIERLGSRFITERLSVRIQPPVPSFFFKAPYPRYIKRRIKTDNSSYTYNVEYLLIKTKVQKYIYKKYYTMFLEQVYKCR